MELSVREMRAQIGRLDELLDAQGEIVITRHGRPVARVIPVQGRRRPDRAQLRASMPPLDEPTEALIRAERDER